MKASAAKQKAAAKLAQLEQRRQAQSQVAAQKRAALERRQQAEVSKLERRQQSQAEELERRQKSQAQAITAKRVALERQVAERKAARPKERKGDRIWRWIALILAILLLLLLFRECEEAPELEPEGVGTVGPALAVEVVSDPAPVVVEPPPPRVVRRDRPNLVPPPPTPPNWLVAFRMQVSARSPRLAECFEGMGRPGQIKWTASVEPTTGRVGDHVIEPLLFTGELSKPERSCIETVLAEPDYRLPPVDPDSMPSRVSLVLEF
ncbi:MAG: hypothetical protein AAGA48_22345 [Myxococcota bacterium]